MSLITFLLICCIVIIISFILHFVFHFSISTIIILVFLYFFKRTYSLFFIFLHIFLFWKRRKLWFLLLFYVSDTYFNANFFFYFFIFIPIFNVPIFHHGYIDSIIQFCRFVVRIHRNQEIWKLCHSFFSFFFISRTKKKVVMNKNKLTNKKSHSNKISKK